MFPSHFPHIYRKLLIQGLATNRFFAFGHVNWHRYLKCQNDLRPVIRADVRKVGSFLCPSVLSVVITCLDYLHAAQ